MVATAGVAPVSSLGFAVGVELGRRERLAVRRAHVDPRGGVPGLRDVVLREDGGEEMNRWSGVSLPHGRDPLATPETSVESWAIARKPHPWTDDLRLTSSIDPSKPRGFNVVQPRRQKTATIAVF